MDPGHRVNSGTLHRWYLSRDDLDFAAVRSCAEFAFLSAVDGSDFPMFWASKIEKQKLREVVESKIRSRDYPASLIIPYVVGAFFWHERAEILPSDYGHKGSVVRILECKDIATFVRTIRRVGSIIRLPGREARIGDGLTTKEAAQEMFEAILRSGDKHVQANRLPLHQLDLFLHVPTGPAD
jgi:hypothetical protein